MAGNKADETEQDWATMNDRERGLALLAIYFADHLLNPDEFLELDDGGAVWQIVNSPLGKLGVEITGMSMGTIQRAHKWLRDNEYLYVDGTGSAAVSYIRRPNAGEDVIQAADQGKEELGELLAAATDKIIAQGTTIAVQAEQIRQQERALAELRGGSELNEAVQERIARLRDALGDN